MRLANSNGRAVIVTDDGAIDVHTRSDGLFGPDQQTLFERWDEFLDWARRTPLDDATAPGPAEFGCPVPTPRQVFGIGLNYADHAAESGVQVPASPAVFTKFPTCLTGPDATVVLPSDTVDWEVELVVVIGRRAEQVAEEKAWTHVAGLSVGQDLSERTLQLSGPVPQFSLGKSYPGFGPVGPWLVTPDALPDPDDLVLSCALGDRVLQQASSKDMIFTVPELIARLSAVCPLLPGDVIFTGTPPGVGMGRNPREYLQPGDVLTSRIEGIGSFDVHLVAGPGHRADAA